MAKERASPSQADQAFDFAAQLPLDVIVCLGELRRAHVARTQSKLSTLHAVGAWPSAEPQRLQAMDRLEELRTSRLANADRVVEVLNEVWTKRSPFVLYLRSYALGARAAVLDKPRHPLAFGRTEYYKVTHERVYDTKLRRALVPALAPIPVLDIRNPEESDNEALSFDSKHDQWPEDAAALIQAASAIVVYIGSPSDGVAYELDTIRRAGRVAETIVVLNGPGPTDASLNGFETLKFDGRFSPEQASRVAALAGAGTHRRTTGNPPCPRRAILEGEICDALLSEADEAFGSGRQLLYYSRHHAALDAFLLAAASFMLLGKSDHFATSALHVAHAYRSLACFHHAAAYAQKSIKYCGPGSPEPEWDIRLWHGIFATMVGKVEQGRRTQEWLNDHCPANLGPDAAFRRDLLSCLIARHAAGGTKPTDEWNRAKRSYDAFRLGGGFPMFPEARYVRDVQATMAESPGWLARRGLRKRIREVWTGSVNEALLESVLSAFDGKVDRHSLLSSAPTPDVEHEVEQLLSQLGC